MATPASKATAYYVLREGNADGPFTEAELRAGVEEGRLKPHDFVQIEGYPIWQPLSRILGTEASPSDGAIAPNWRTLATWVWLRIRYHFDEHALATGGVFLGIGTLVLALVLAQWGVVLWLPWFAAAAFAGVILLRRHQAEQALMILAGAVILPFLLFFIVPKRASTVAQSTQESLDRLRLAPTPDSAPQVVAVIPQREASVPSTPVPLPDAPEPPPAPPRMAAASPAVAAATPLPQPPPAEAPLPPFLTPRKAVQSAQNVDALSKPPPNPSVVAASPPLSPAAASVSTEGVPADAAELIQRHRDSFIVVNGREGSGSGFICRVGGTPYLFTNIHVVAGIAQPLFTRLDGTAVRPGAAAAAAGHDILRFNLADPVTQPLEAMSDTANNLRLGDDVVVLGNSGGGGVITSMKGQIVGLGPDRIEVSAEFIPGNSGSPIIHVRTGTVIGVATYLTSRYEAFVSNPSGQAPPAAAPTPAPSTPQRFNPRKPGSPWAPVAATPAPTPPPQSANPGTLVVRRFGYRLDSVRQWEPVNWTVFRQEGEELRKISALTEDVIDFLGALRERRTPNFNTLTLRRPATEWFTTIRNKTTSDADRLRGTAAFLRTLRSMVRTDVAAAETHVRYSYFREDLRKEREVRDRLYNAFDTEAQSLASPR